MLSTGSTGSVGIDAQIIFIDLHFHIFLDIRHNITGYKGCLPFSSRIERGNTHQPVDPFLGLQITIGILSVHLECNRLNACFLTVQIIQHFHFKSFGRCPSGVHTIQHTCPVTGLCSTGTCMQGHNGIVSVVFTGQQCFHTNIFKTCFKLIQQFLNLRNDFRIIFLISHLDHKFHIFHLGCEPMINFHIIFLTFKLFHKLLGTLRIVPEIRLLHFPL